MPPNRATFQSRLSARSFCLGCAVGYVLQVAMKYAEGSAQQAGSADSRWLGPLVRLMEQAQGSTDGDSGRTPPVIGLRDVVLSLGEQQLHHMRALQAALLDSIRGPLRYRYELAWLALRTVLTLPTLKALSGLARASLRRAGLHRPRVRAWLTEAERRLLGSPWLGVALTLAIVIAAAVIVAPAEAHAAGFGRAGGAAVGHPGNGSHRHSLPRLPACRFVSWHTLHCEAQAPSSTPELSSSFLSLPLPDAADVGWPEWLWQSTGAPLIAFAYFLARLIPQALRGAAALVYSGAAACLHPLRFALLGLAMQAGLASLMTVAILIRFLLVEWDSTRDSPSNKSSEPLAPAAADLDLATGRPALASSAAESGAIVAAGQTEGRQRAGTGRGLTPGDPLGTPGAAASRPPAPGATCGGSAGGAIPGWSTSGGARTDAALLAVSCAAAGGERLGSPRAAAAAASAHTGIPRSASLTHRLADLAGDVRELRARGWLRRLRKAGSAVHLVMCTVPVWQLLSLFWELSRVVGADEVPGAHHGPRWHPGRGPPALTGAAEADAAARGFRALTALCFLLWVQTIGRTCWLLLSLALVRDDKLETAFAASMEWTSIAPRFEWLLSALTRGLAIFPPSYVFWYAAARELFSARGTPLRQLVMLACGAGLSELFSSATSLAPNAPNAALWQSCAEFFSALTPVIALTPLGSPGVWRAPPRALLVLLIPATLAAVVLLEAPRRGVRARGEGGDGGDGRGKSGQAWEGDEAGEDPFGDVTAHNASLRGLIWLATGRTETEPLMPSPFQRSRSLPRGQTAAAGVIAGLLSRDGPLQRALWRPGGSPIPAELRPIARLFLEYAYRATNDHSISTGMGALWPVGGSLLASLLHNVFLSRRGRTTLRAGLKALRAQEEEMAPPDELKFPRDVLEGLRRWTAMPGLGVRGCVVAHDDLKLGTAVPASR
jgi:hypothetical protein